MSRHSEVSTVSERNCVRNVADIQCKVSHIRDGHKRHTARRHGEPKSEVRRYNGLFAPGALGGVRCQIEGVFVLQEFELLKVAEAIVSHGLAGGFIHPLLLGAEHFADFGELGLADGGVDVADGAVAILLDRDAFVAELNAQGIDALVELVHDA